MRSELSRRHFALVIFNRVKHKRTLLQRLSIFKHRCLHSVARLQWGNYLGDQKIRLGILVLRVQFFRRGIESKEADALEACIAHAHKSSASMCMAFRSTC